MTPIFVNNHPIYLVDDLKFRSENNFYNIKDVDIVSLIKKLENNEIGQLYLYSADLDSLWQQFSSKFKIIKAAGGKVFNAQNEILFIFRNNKWDLPKGKIEKGEEIKEAAIREVEEETGVKQLKIIKPLDSTYHIYKRKENYIFKISYWFEMSTNFVSDLEPQLEEGITKVAFLNEHQIRRAMKNTYANIKLLFK